MPELFESSCSSLGPFGLRNLLHHCSKRLGLEKMSKESQPIPEDRELTAEEYQITRWLLEHGKEEARQFIEQLEHARIVSRCPCGCASVDFSIDGKPHAAGGMNILSDYLFGDESDPKGIFVWECNGILSGIEVWGCATDAPTSLPSVESLRPYGPELL
jgi:hypothetical protein